MDSSLNKRVILLFSLFLIFSCKKQKSEINILELSRLNNYKITEKKINDSVGRIFGENNRYSIEGDMLLSNRSKQGWWNIKSKTNKDRFEIEYLFLDKQIENQIKIFKNGVFDSKQSQYYHTYFSGRDNRYSFDIHFPESKNKTYNVDFDFIVTDTLQRKKVREGNMKCIQNEDIYSCNVPVNKNEAVIGLITKSSYSKDKDSVNLIIDRMYIKGEKQNAPSERVQLINPR